MRALKILVTPHHTTDPFRPNMTTIENTMANKNRMDVLQQQTFSEPEKPRACRQVSFGKTFIFTEVSRKQIKRTKKKTIPKKQSRPSFASMNTIPTTCTLSSWQAIPDLSSIDQIQDVEPQCKLTREVLHKPQRQSILRQSTSTPTTIAAHGSSSTSSVSIFNPNPTLSKTPSVSLSRQSTSVSSLEQYYMNDDDCPTTQPQHVTEYNDERTPEHHLPSPTRHVQQQHVQPPKFTFNASFTQCTEL
eukprot:m.72127 g.72127  ORF g.72127 m.72127 type:complete len:246 (-) comp24429_c0_seq3:622-1359(-)